MQNFLISLSIILSISVNAQDDLLKNQNEVKQTILNFFEGFHNRDTVKLKSTISEQMVMQTIAKNNNGDHESVMGDVNTFLAAIHNRPEKMEWEERLLGFRIDANANIAQAWTPYEFYINKKFSHCGVNIFQLFHNGETWKIIAIADTRKKEGCF